MVSVPSPRRVRAGYLVAGVLLGTQFGTDVPPAVVVGVLLLAVANEVRAGWQAAAPDGEPTD
ncbi:MAG: hypothetical protein ABEI75_04055 [Halobaculum sp.]